MGDTLSTAESNNNNKQTKQKTISDYTSSLEVVASVEFILIVFIFL